MKKMCAYLSHFVIQIVSCQVFDFTLEAEEMKSITALNKGWRYIVPMIEVSRLSVLCLLWLVFLVLLENFALSSSFYKKYTGASDFHCRGSVVWWLNFGWDVAGGREAGSQGCRTSSLPFQRRLLMTHTTT